MKVVILAGGFGTRISEESHLRPKPMIEIGGLPILWHIMKIYSHYGFNDFVICAGYKQHRIKEFFADYYVRNNDVTFDFANGGMSVSHTDKTEPWKVTVVDTGFNTMTGGRIKRIEEFIDNQTFMMTYGDGVADINIAELLSFHTAHKKKATLTGVNITQRFGILDVSDSGQITSFREKKHDDHNVVNGGFMVLEPSVFSYIVGDDTVFENDPLESLASDGELMVYYHNGFWQCMDTQRDKEQLERLWQEANAPWKSW